LLTFCANPQLVFGPVVIPDPQVWVVPGVDPALRRGATPLAVDPDGGALLLVGLEAVLFDAVV
jgi:hypothetical protein